MTEITFQKSETGDVLGFRSAGHAEYDSYGKDIVCAGISALVINTINSLEELTGEEMEVEAKEETGTIYCHFLNTPIKESSKLLVDSLILGLTHIEKTYGRKHCRLKFEEV